MATSPGIVLGTAAYMSSEQAKGLEVDRTTDVWAFGCVLYEMLAGRPAFAGATTAEVLSEILRSEPDWTGLPRETPASIRRLLRRCLRKDRRDIPPVVDMSSLTRPLIAVCVATYHRPALLDLLLASLKAIEVPKGCAVECRIVDNDKAGSARETAERWAAAGTLPGKLRYEIEPTQGISAARNHALDMGPADLHRVHR